MEQIYNYIAGSVARTDNERWLKVFEPATGQVYARAPESTADDLDLAIDAARQAAPQWMRSDGAQRGRILMRLADMIEERAEEFALAESVDTGKPLQLARQLDIPRAVANLRFFAGAAEHFSSESHAMENGAINYTLRQPLGIVGCISPWNLPLYLFTWKIAPALAAGNAVIAKPSELTPMTAYLFSRLLTRAGLPEGVLNILYGTGRSIGQQIVDHDDVAAVSFTGGTVTGEKIARSTAGSFKKLSLEMGGKNPSIIFADCNWEPMLDNMLRASFSNQGEICLCGSRILIERSVYQRFREEFVARVKKLTVGDPLLDKTDQGALVSETHMKKVLGHIDDAIDEGGTVLCGGKRVVLEGRCAKGWFVQPTVIEGLPAQCKTNQQEIFGPVVTLMPFDDESEAIAIANDTEYGLATSIWSADVSRCLRVAREINAGLVWVNTWMMRDLRTPMGGMKRSGLGREGGFEAMRFFTEAKNVCVRYE